MGRKKIAIKPIEDLNKRYVAFCKRKDGLFNKAQTASRMYGSTIGIFVFSPTAAKLHTFGPVDSLIDHLLLHHQSSSSISSSSSLINPPPLHLNSTTTFTEGKKRSRSEDDDDRVPMMLEERETKKRKLLMSSSSTIAAAAAATDHEEEEKEEEFLLVENSETEQEGLMMMNEFMGGFEQNINVTDQLEEELLGESQSSREETADVDYNIMGSSSLSTVVTTTTTTSQQLVASSLESVDDEELDEVLRGFADYIITGTDTDQYHPYDQQETTTMFDLLPHQGVYDDEGCFTFCDNWPTMDQLLS